MKPVDDLPPAVPAMWRALKRGYQAEPLLLAVAFGLSLLAALPDALMALWLKLIADGVLGGNGRRVMGAAVGLGVSAAATWFLRVISDRTQRHFRDRVTIVLDHMYMSVFSTCGWILRLAVTVALLISIHPVLALLVLFALPTVLTSSW